MITKVKTPVIHPNFAPLPTESGRPVRLQYIHTAIKPAPIDHRMKRNPTNGVKSRSIDSAAAAKATRRTTGLANETPESPATGNTGAVRMIRGASTGGSGSPDVGLPHLWQKRAPSTNWVPQVQYSGIVPRARDVHPLQFALGSPTEASEISVELPRSYSTITRLPRPLTLCISTLPACWITFISGNLSS
jgi:hypothetical protein